MSERWWTRRGGKLSGLLSLTLGLALMSAAPVVAQERGRQLGPQGTGVFNLFATSVGLNTGFDAVANAVGSGLGSAIGSLPNPTGGGFTYRFDPTLGVFSRTTESFGPIFSDRADTTGRNKFTFNLSFTHHTFDDADGVSLRDGDIRFFFDGNLDSFGNVRRNIVELREEVRADVFTLGAIYGVTDRIDVGISIPIVNVSDRITVRRAGFRDCTPGCGPFIPAGSAGLGDLINSDSAEKTGIGDITFRGKYNFAEWPDLWTGRLGLAASLDVKVPTGDRGDHRARLNLFDTSRPVFDISGDPPTGTGIVRVKPLFIVSGDWYGVSPHINVGAELGTTEGIRNELVYAVGVDWTFLRRFTLTLDVLGRHAFDVDRTKVVIPDSSTRRLAPFTPGKADADIVTGSVGLKANVIGTLLLFANVLFPINDTGVRDDITPTVGVEWSF